MIPIVENSRVLLFASICLPLSTPDRLDGVTRIGYAAVVNTPTRALAFILLVIAVAASPLRAEDDGAVIRIRLAERIRISERTNLSARVDGRYAGLLNRQVSGYLTRAEGTRYEGRFFLYEQARRDARQVARPIDRSVTSSLRITESTLFAGASGYPTLQDLLSLPGRELRRGDRWSAPATILLDPRREGRPLRLPVAVDYQLVGVEPWNGAPAYRIEARFATRFPLPPREGEGPAVRYDGTIASVRGSHSLTIMLPADGADAFYRDEVREEYRFGDGSTLLHEGHVLLFMTGLSAGPLERIASDVEEALRADEVSGVTVDRTSTGVRITIDSLRFVADRAVLLPDERPRLDAIAAALARAEGSRFLIVGHTADVGTPESQQSLSVERAELVASALALRGVSPERMDVEGRGGREPVASNDDEQGRAANRRVEIYVVEE